MLTVWFSSDWILFLRILELTFGRPCTSGWQWRFGRARFWSGSGCCWAFPVPAAGSPDSRPARPHYSWSAGLTSGWWRRAWANSGPALQTLLSQRRCIILHNHISIANISLSVGNVFFVLFLPEISSSSTSDWKLLRFSQVGGEYFFRVTCWRPMVLFAVLTKFLDSVLEETAAQTFQSFEKSELCYV